MIRIGPAGVTDGRGIYAWDDGGKEKIVQIFIAHGDSIDSLQYVYVDENGKLVLSASHGVTFGTSKFDLASWKGRLFDGILFGVLLQDYMNMTYDRMKSINDSVIEFVPKCSIEKYSPFQVYVRLSYPSEFLSGISGWHVSGIIRSLTFITNKRTYGPFGGVARNIDTAFEYKLGEDNKFAGYHGTAGTYNLNSIGVYMKPIMTLANVNNAKASGVLTVGLVDGACAKTSNPSFCRAALLSDGRSATANLTELGGIAIDLTVVSSMATQTKITMLEEQTKDVELKKSLGSCFVEYEKVVADYCPFARIALAFRDYINLYSAGDYIIRSASICDGAFSSPPSYPCPITFENKKSSLLGGIIKTIANILT
ncbi:hypothetical protein RHSIM_Rhsim04G0238300 [Rhododendron simsii]|uniref:Jacalin-type lectin domain-containing protein n=1 Tax=Rhododendron simsii TaxID=118357 RepID=A0A834H2A3_RHOSS|nr:hypothetical protein RHSIM_Rhsim04G0238300 [Rhododendron simsii]